MHVADRKKEAGCINLLSRLKFVPDLLVAEVTLDGASIINAFHPPLEPPLTCALEFNSPINYRMQEQAKASLYLGVDTASNATLCEPSPTPTGQILIFKTMKVRIIGGKYTHI